MTSSERQPGPSVPKLRELTALVRRAAAAYERPDLVASLDRLDASLRTGTTRVVVAGDFKRGKSSLTNALVNATVCSTDEARTTARPTIVRYGAETTIRAIRTDDGDETATDIDASTLFDHQDGGDADVDRLEVTLDRRLLADGLEIVDCPAAAGEGDPGRRSTLAAAAEADAVIYVTDATQELNAHEVELLQAIAGRCPTVVVATTKIDMTTRWQETVRRDTATLARHDLPVPNVPVSTAVRTGALAHGSRELNEESGFPVLIDAVRDRVIDRAADVALLRAERLLRRAVADLEQALQHESRRLDDPDALSAATEAVEQAKGEAEQLRGQNSRWQRILNEGAGDLQAELEHEFGERIRGLVDAANERIDEINPTKDWETFEPWLREQLADAVEASMVSAQAGMAALADEAAAAFASAEVQITGAVNGLEPAELEALDVRDRMQRNRAAVLGDGLAAIRGSYSGLLMFGMLGSMMGFAILNPVTIALGVGLGGKAVKDERARMMAQRRSQATTAVRGYIDQVAIRGRKEMRSLIKTEQRTVREHLAAHADELVKAADAALARARQNAQADAIDRNKRRTDVNAEVRRVRELKTRVDAALTAEQEAAR